MATWQDEGFSSPQDYLNHLNEVLANTAGGTSEYKKMEAQIKKTTKEIENLNSSVTSVNKEIEKSTEEQSKLWTFAERNFKAGADAIKNYKEAMEKFGAGDPGGAMLALAQEGLDFLQKEADTREHIIEQINTTGEASRMMTRNLMEAELETLRWGSTSEDLAKTMGALSSDMGRAFQISPQAIASLDALRVGLDLSSSDLSSLIKQFDIMGIGVDEATGEIEEMSKVARGMGLNVSKFMGSVASNLKMANTFKFRDGVQGFTRMAAQAQRLHFDMSQISKMATDLFDPEAAIDMAANFQIMGGAMGDLTDPFRLMYLATNDIGGLQDAIVGAAEASVMFNEETGEFDISSTELRRMKSMADQLGMSLEDFVTAAKKSKSSTMALKQMGGLELIDPKSGEDMKEFAANMSQMKGGRFMIDLPEIGEVALEDIDTKTELEALRKLQDQQGMDTKDIALEQLSAQEQIANNTAALMAGVTLGAMGDTGDPGSLRAYTDSLLGMANEALAGPVMKELAMTIGRLGSGVAEAVISGDEKNMERQLNRMAKNFEKVGTSLEETLLKDFPLLHTVLEQLIHGTPGEQGELQDFISRPGMGLQKFSGGDLVVGLKEPNFHAMPAMTEINTAVNTFNNSSNLTTAQRGPIDINLNMNGRAVLDMQGITTEVTAAKLQEVMGENQFQMWLMSQVGERISQGGNAFQNYGTTT
tara:strand:+ start:892 stop:3000 length:2109 start_codon:yes stop_codon:yes gene_type:complete